MRNEGFIGIMVHITDILSVLGLDSGTPSGKGLYLTVYPLSTRILYTVYFTLITLYCILYTLYSTLYTAHSIQHTVNCSLFTVHSVFTVPDLHKSKQILDIKCWPQRIRRYCLNKIWLLTVVIINLTVFIPYMTAFVRLYMSHKLLSVQITTVY